MFYTYELLCKQRGGKFSSVYRAATIGIKKSINDNDLDTLNVVELGQEIYVMITTKSMNMKDRLALRLSAILVNGLIRIHSAQVDQLLEKCGGRKSLAFGDLADIVPIIASSTEQSSELATPELFIAKQRKPRRPRKKPASKPVSDLSEFRIPQTSLTEKESQNGHENVIREIALITPQRDTAGYPLTADDSPPQVNQMNIVVEADVHVPAERTIVTPETIHLVAREEPMQDDAVAQYLYTIAPAKTVDPSTQIYVSAVRDQTVVLESVTPDRLYLVQSKEPKEPDALFTEHKNRPRKINRDLRQEAILKRKRRILADKSGLDLGDLECYFQIKEGGEFTEDEYRDAISYSSALDNLSHGAITTPQASLSHHEMSKSIKDSIGPDEDFRRRKFSVGIEMEGIELMQAITEDQGEEQIQDFNKLSKRAQRLLNKLKKLHSSLKVSIDDLCRKPIHKKEIVIIFQALLEIHSNTNIIDLVIRGAGDFYLDYILIK